MKQTDYAWVAGFLDGEGYFQSTKTYYVKRKDGKGLRIKSYSYFKINASQSDPRVLRKLKRIIGGTITGPYHHKNSNQSPYFNFCLCSKAEQVFKKIYPYLGTVKRKQGVLAIARTAQENLKLRGRVYGNTR